MERLKLEDLLILGKSLLSLFKLVLLCEAASKISQEVKIERNNQSKSFSFKKFNLINIHF